MRSVSLHTRKMAPGGRASRTARVSAACPLLALLIAMLSLPAPPAAPATVSGCDRYASAVGSDSAPGSQTRPFRTAQKLANSLHRGKTGCLRAGTYSFSQLNVKKPKITLAPYGSEAVTLRGDIKVLPNGHGTVIEEMTLNGYGGKNELGPRIYADGVVLRDNEITNQHTGICVQVSSFFSKPAPRHVTLARNRIHDCGRLPATNHSHGIYLVEARRTTIRDNWIYDNADRGIQLYPEADRTLVSGNVVDSNGHGISFGGDGSGQCSNHNKVKGNVIANSKIRWNAYSGAQGPPCQGNVVRGNCVYGSNSNDRFNTNGGIETPSKSFSAHANRIAAPEYVNPAAGDFRLQPGSACEDLLDTR